MQAREQGSPNVTFYLDRGGVMQAMEQGCPNITFYLDRGGVMQAGKGAWVCKYNV